MRLLVLFLVMIELGGEEGAVIPLFDREVTITHWEQKIGVAGIPANWLRGHDLREGWMHVHVEVLRRQNVNPLGMTAGFFSGAGTYMTFHQRHKIAGPGVYDYATRLKKCYKTDVDWDKAGWPAGVNEIYLALRNRQKDEHAVTMRVAIFIVAAGVDFKAPGMYGGLSYGNISISPLRVAWRAGQLGKVELSVDRALAKVAGTDNPHEQELIKIRDALHRHLKERLAVLTSRFDTDPIAALVGMKNLAQQFAGGQSAKGVSDTMRQWQKQAHIKTELAGHKAWLRYRDLYWAVHERARLSHASQSSHPSPGDMRKLDQLRQKVIATWPETAAARKAIALGGPTSSPSP